MSGFKHIVCGVAHALHGVFVRDIQPQHDGGVDVAKVMEAEAGDAAAVAGTLEAVIHGVPGIVDHIVIFMRRVGQQPADIGREAQPPVAAVGFGLLQLGAVLALHHGLLDDKSLALHAVPGESTNFGGAQAQPDGQEKGEFKLGAFAILVHAPNIFRAFRKCF